MSIYNHKQLFADEEETVEVYCLPQRLIDYISDFARTSRVAYSDVVVEALLQYFSDRIAADLNRAVAGEGMGLALADGSAAVENLMFSFDQQGLEALHDDFCDYFSASLMLRAKRLQASEEVALRKGEQQKIDQKDLEIATLKLLLEKSNKQLTDLSAAN